MIKFPLFSTIQNKAKQKNRIKQEKNPAGGFETLKFSELLFAFMKYELFIIPTFAEFDIFKCCYLILQAKRFKARTASNMYRIVKPRPDGSLMLLK